MSRFQSLFTLFVRKFTTGKKGRKADLYLTNNVLSMEATISQRVGTLNEKCSNFIKNVFFCTNFPFSIFDFTLKSSTYML